MNAKEFVVRIVTPSSQPALPKAKPSPKPSPKNPKVEDNKLKKVEKREIQPIAKPDAGTPQQAPAKPMPTPKVRYKQHETKK